MGRVELKKQQKRDALMKSAYDLFISQGFTSTTIRDIALRAGVAKGTFYLYFKDKTDIREAVIRSTAGNLLREASSKLDERIRSGEDALEVADIFIYIIDYLVESVAKDKLLVRFISKHLSWGMFSSGAAGRGHNHSDEMDVEGFVISKLAEYNVRIKDLKLLIFTLLELVSSTCHDVILYQKPISLEEYKPYLNNCIRLLVNNSIAE